jgi:hypothetical protein
MGASTHRAARVTVVAIAPMLLVACIPGPLGLATTDGSAEESDGSAQVADASPPDADAHTSGADSSATGIDSSLPPEASAGPDAQPDVVDAAPLMQGYIRCAGTTVACDIAAQAECCLTVDGMLSGGDAAATFAFASADCEEAGGPNCGFYGTSGNTSFMVFPQTCSTAADCAMGDACCVALDTTETWVSGISCQPACASPSRIVCLTSADCRNGQQCLPETDSILMHLYSRYCR